MQRWRSKGLSEEQCRKYQERQDVLWMDSAVLAGMFLTVKIMFVWASDSQGIQVFQRVCHGAEWKAGVLCTPGDAFGSLGKAMCVLPLFFHRRS